MTNSADEQREQAASDVNVDLTSLKQQRGTVKRNISLLKKKVEGNDDDITILECRLQILESYFKQICHLQNQIEKLSPADMARGEFEDLYVETKAKMVSKINNNRSSMQLEQTVLNPNTISAHFQPRLPNLKLPKFDGKYGEYSRFITSFRNMVHENSSISSVDKFNYLRDCLSGPALAVVEPFQITDANYKKALDRLKERYDNKVLIFLEHITALFNVSEMCTGDGGSLRSLIDKVSALRGSLLSIGSAEEIVDGIFSHIVLSKVDIDTKRSFDEKQTFSSMPSWQNCYETLSHRCQYLECHGKGCATQLTRFNKAKPTNTKTTAHAFVNSSRLCEFCKTEGHYLASCVEFAKLMVSERFNYIKKNGHCINCLRKGHLLSKCSSKSRCRVCGGSHHTILHIFQSSQEQPNSSMSITPSSSSLLPSLSANVVSFVTQCYKGTILPTAVVSIADSCGSFVPARVLLDSCSEINFISEELAKRLKLKFKCCTQDISGIGEVQTTVKYSVEATIKSRVTSFQWTSNFAVTKSISAFQPGESISTENWEIPSSIKLADPLFYKKQSVDLLISTEIFLELLLDGSISLGVNMPTLRNTVFGWIIGGKFTPTKPSLPRICNLAISKVSNDDLHQSLENFWKIEEYTNNLSTYTEEEMMCEQRFVDEAKIDSNGRICVKYAFKRNPNCLGESYENCYKRFTYLERKLSRDPCLKSQYVDFMNEYISLGHMSPHTEILKHPYYIIPHHCVLRPLSLTTKLRVVFDGSSPTSSGISLNEILMVGPTIQQDLITTMFSFRLNKYALIADISKMYRQFEIDEEQRKYQLILWRSDPKEALKVYHLNTVTYGLSAAPFLAIRSLFFIADKYAATHPTGSKTLREDLYVDDVLTGAHSVDLLMARKAQLVDILEKHGLHLTKWNSNSTHLVLKPDPEIKLKTSDSDITKTLGMSWKPHNDVFCFRFDLPNVEPPTKRSVTSIIAKIFDLLGLLSPIIVRCKMLLQELWIQKVGWDEHINPHLVEIWSRIQNDLENLHHIEVPRYVFSTPNTFGEVHGFSDASQRAYGCCLYFRVLENNEFKTTLLIAKSKVAPIKALSLPKLELCAAVLLNKTWNKIKSKISPYTSSVYFWTDSKIVLQWLTHHSSSLNCFVGNRISELQENSSNIIWRHVPTTSNPADIVSRGCSAAELPSTMWFQGPSFLRRDSCDWPPNLKLTSTSEVPEKKKAAVFKTTTDTVSILEQIIDNHSSFFKILRIIAYMYRVFNRCAPNKLIKEEEILNIPCLEIQEAFWSIVAQIQAKYFETEMNEIEKGKSLQPSLQKLAPFIQNMKLRSNSVNLLRVGGRLCHANIPYDAKFPALLPKDHKFVRLYVEYLHKLHLHAGAKVLLGLVRQKIWIINGREVIRKIVRNCVHCFHYKPKLLNQMMGNLPADRLSAQRPFTITGVDFCGPFITSYRIRGKVPYKTYVAVFVCFSSKAIHLEAVSDLASDTFLMALKRFVSRRGAPKRIFCDNATNFLGASNKLDELKKTLLNNDSTSKIVSYSSKIGFEFCFIPPRAPHFGGLWESAVKSAKTLLVKNVAECRLSYEELQTLLSEIEAILNSRPISPMSNDPNDGEALTPGHLLIGSSLVGVPEQQIEVSNVSLLSRYQQLTFLKKQFWHLWSRDYIQSLQQRTKWLKADQNVHIGQLVIIHEDNTPPQNWLLARITKIFPGSDGRIRVIELKTKNGICRRPIHKVAPVPLDEVH